MKKRLNSKMRLIKNKKEEKKKKKVKFKYDIY